MLEIDQTGCDPADLGLELADPRLDGSDLGGQGRLLGLGLGDLLLQDADALVIRNGMRPLRPRGRGREYKKKNQAETESSGHRGRFRGRTEAPCPPEKLPDLTESSG